jgi:hypothetical protein
VIRSILFVLGALVVTIALWGIYQLIGEYLFLFFLVVAFIAILKDVKPKFGSKKKANE